MMKGMSNQNKALEALKTNKTKSAKAAFSKTEAKSKTPLTGMSIAAKLKMSRLKPKK
jgi:hypothetical protein